MRSEAEIIEDLIKRTGLRRNAGDVHICDDTLGRSGERMARYVARLCRYFTTTIFILVGDEVDAGAKIKASGLDSGFAESVNYILSGNNMVVPVDNGLKTFRWNDSKWKGLIVQEPNDPQGSAVNSAVRDNPLILALAEQNTTGQALTQNYAWTGRNIYIMSTPIYASGPHHLDNAMNSLRNGLQLTYTRIDDLTNREVFLFWAGVDTDPFMEEEFRNELEEKLNPTKLTMIGGSVPSRRRRLPFLSGTDIEGDSNNTSLALVLLLRLKRSDENQLGKQFHFLKPLEIPETPVQSSSG